MHHPRKKQESVCSEIRLQVSLVFRVRCHSRTVLFLSSSSASWLAGFLECWGPARVRKKLCAVEWAAKELPQIRASQEMSRIDRNFDETGRGIKPSDDRTQTQSLGRKARSPSEPWAQSS